MKTVLAIVKQLESTNSNKEKLAILEENKDNEMLKKVLYYTYRDDVKYGITRAKIKPNHNPESQPVYDMFSILDCLAENNINDSYRKLINDQLGIIGDKELIELWTRVLTKDLKCGITKKTVGKVFSEMKKYEIQQANSIHHVKIKEGTWLAISQKLNGFRGTFQHGKILSRQNKEIKGLCHITNKLNQLFGDEYVLDGELVRINTENSIDGKGVLSDEENFQATVSIVNSDIEQKLGVEFVLYDIIPTKEFDELWKSTRRFPARRKQLSQIEEVLKQNNVTTVRALPLLYQGTDQSQIKYWMDYAVEHDWEGVMINLDTEYFRKRHSGILKAKTFFTVDLRVVGFESGKLGSKYENTLGSLVLEYKNNKVNADGMTDEMRDEIWNNKEKYIGKIAEIQHKGETKDNKTGLPSLNFPKFKRWRDDKTEPSYE